MIIIIIFSKCIYLLVFMGQNGSHILINSYSLAYQFELFIATVTQGTLSKVILVETQEIKSRLDVSKYLLALIHDFVWKTLCM